VRVESGSNRVIRGGSWNNNARSANRNNESPGELNDNLVFRLVSTKQSQLDKVHGPRLRASICPDPHTRAGATFRAALDK
jgi:hypothetical protein